MAASWNITPSNLPIVSVYQYRKFRPMLNIFTLAASRGLGNITYALKDVADNHNVSYGDMYVLTERSFAYYLMFLGPSIQFAGAVALSNCPGSPRLQFLAGRPEAQSASPPNLVPPPSGSVDSILSRMADAGFTADDTVALLAAHSVGRQEVTDLTVPGMPLDSTPGRFDGQFYLEVSKISCVRKVSDIIIVVCAALWFRFCLKQKTIRVVDRTRPCRPNPRFQTNSGSLLMLPLRVPLPPHVDGTISSVESLLQFTIPSRPFMIIIDRQSQLTSAFRNAMIKLANNGQDVGKLIDCSDAIPIPEFWNGPTVLPQGKTLEDLDHPVSYGALQRSAPDCLTVYSFPSSALNSHSLKFSRQDDHHERTSVDDKDPVLHWTLITLYRHVLKTDHFVAQPSVDHSFCHSFNHPYTIAWPARCTGTEPSSSVDSWCMVIGAFHCWIGLFRASWPSR